MHNALTINNWTYNEPSSNMTLTQHKMFYYNMYFCVVFPIKNTDFKVGNLLHFINLLIVRNKHFYQRARQCALCFYITNIFRAEGICSYFNKIIFSLFTLLASSHARPLREIYSTREGTERKCIFILISSRSAI